MQLSPSEKYPIVRQLDNVNDTGTYYVRCVIKNAYNGTTLDTIDLTNQGEQYFSALWSVPNDVNGNGTYITMTTFVYTDSAYTQLSTTYATDSVVHVIQLRPIFPSGIGGGSNIDYNRLQQIVEGKKIDIPVYDEAKLKREIIKEVKELISSMRPKDTSGNVIDEIGKKIESHSSLLRGKLDEVSGNVNAHRSETSARFDDTNQKIANGVQTHEQSIKNLHGEMPQMFKDHWVNPVSDDLRAGLPEMIKGQYKDLLENHGKRLDKITQHLVDMDENIRDAAESMKKPVQFKFDIPRMESRKDTDIESRISKLL